MCEIAVYPGSSNADEQKALAETLYSENPDGLGMVAVYDGDEFDYSVHKSESPDFDAVRGFLNAHSDAWRIITHARLATAGGTGFQETHPIEPRCNECDVDYIIHNGGVYGHNRDRKALERRGHDFTTAVDSEVIAHKHGGVPDSLDDFNQPQLAGSLNYLVLSDNGILIRNDGKYRVSYDMQMSCGYRGWQNRDDCEQGYALFRPDRSVEKVDLQQQMYKSSQYRYASQTTLDHSSDDDDDNDDGGLDTGNGYSRGSGTAHEGVSQETEDWFRAKGWQFCDFHDRFYSEDCPDCVEESMNRPPSSYNGCDWGRY